MTEFKAIKFSSLDEFLRHVDTCPRHAIRKGWSGARTYEEAVEISRMGVELDRVRLELSKLEHTRPEMQTVMDVCGSVVHMDAYLAGEPENMMEFPIAENPTKFLNVFIDVTEHADVPQEYMVNKAIAIASLVDELENNNYRVAIMVGNIISFDKSFSTGTYTPSMAMTAIRIKEYHDVLSVGQLIGCIHPSFLRVLWFGFAEGLFRKVGGTPEGIGRSASKPVIREVLNENADPDTVYLPNSRVAGGDLSTIAGAIEMVERYIGLKANTL